VITPFLMLEWARCRFHKKHTGTRNAKLVFLHQVGSTGHVVQPSVSGVQNVIAIFFMLRWDWYGFNKNHATTLCSELVFLNLTGSTSHVVHSAASGA
jgi:hypothetical protein